MNDKKILNAAIKTAGLQSIARKIWTHHPLLENMVTSLVNYTGTHAQCANGSSLLIFAIENAFSSYQEAMDKGAQENTAIGDYVRSLLKSSTQVFCQRIVIETGRGEVLWAPFVCSLLEFITQHPGGEISVTTKKSNISDAIATAFMMTKIIPHSLLDNESLSELFDEIKEI